MNAAGHPETLVASHPGNSNRLVHGLYSARRNLPPEAVELADRLMETAGLEQGDRAMAEEAAALQVLVDRLDGVLLAPGSISRKPRTLLDHRARLSRQLVAALRELGLTPRVRAEYAARMGSPVSLAEELAKLRESAEG
jgi:hypothetical protein